MCRAACLMVLLGVLRPHGRCAQIIFDHRRPITRAPTVVEVKTTRCGQADGCKAESPAIAFKAISELLLAHRPGQAHIRGAGPHIRGAGPPLGAAIALSRPRSRRKARTPISMDEGSRESDLENSSKAERLEALEADVAALEALEELEAKLAALEANVAALDAETAKQKLINSIRADLRQKRKLKARLTETKESVPRTLKVGTTRAEFLEFLKATAEQLGGGVAQSERLQQIVAKALDEGRDMQRAEIDQLQKLLENSLEKGPAPPKSEFPSLVDRLSKVNDAELTVQESQDLARDAFKEFAALNEEVEANDEKDGRKIIVDNIMNRWKILRPGTGLVASRALRQRLKSLQQHDAASCIEYRLFAIALSQGDSLEEALGSCLVEDEGEVRLTSLGFGRLARTIEGDLNMDDWSLDMDNHVLSSWLEQLADLLKRTLKSPEKQESESFSRIPILGFSSFEPMFISVPYGQIGRHWFPGALEHIASHTGNFEPLVVYYLSRLLARFNVQAVARFESRAVPLNPDAIVTEQESKYSSNTQEVLYEKRNNLDFLLSLASLDFKILLLDWISDAWRQRLLLSTSFFLFVIYAVFSTLFGLVSGIFTPPPVDPFAF